MVSLGFEPRASGLDGANDILRSVHIQALELIEGSGLPPQELKAILHFLTTRQN